MATKPIAYEKSVNDQASHRYMDTFRDQHKSRRFPDGRPWWGWREYASMKGQPDGFVSADLFPGSHEDPAQRWTAPWLPEADFFDFNYRKSAVIINYRKMLTHDTHYWHEYYRAANRMAFEKGWEEVHEGRLPRASIRHVIGEPPRSPKIAQAALAGDRWLLGDESERNVNEELASLLGMNRLGIKIERDLIVGASTPESVLQLTREELRLLIQEEAAKLVAEKPRRPHRRTRPLPPRSAPTELPAAAPTETAA